MKDNLKPSLNNKHLVDFLHDLIFQLGINTAHDYDGLESDEDILIYQESVKRRIKTLQNNLKIDTGIKYYSIVCNITPYMCKPITYCVVISENVKDFLDRNNTKYENIILLGLNEISKSEYNLRKLTNPDNDGCYLKMLKNDYVKFYEDE